MYEQFLSLEFWRCDDKQTADLYDKAKQFAQFFNYVFDSIASILTAFISVLAGFVALIFVSWWLALILLVAVVPSIIVQLRLSRKKVQHWDQTIDTRRKQLMIEYEMLRIDRIAELKLYGLVRSLLDLRMKLRDKDEKVRIEFERKFIWRQLGADVLEAAAEVTALVYTTLQIIAQAQPVGQFLYVQQIVSRALSGAREFVSGISRMDEDIAKLFDYNEFMALEQASLREVTLGGAPSNITVRSASFAYPGSENQVLRDVSATISKGQHIAIIGENGAGKSTLIKLLLGLYQPTSGAVLLDDTNLNTIKLDTWHRHIGLLQQDFGVYPFANARENVLYGNVEAAYSEKRLMSAIKEAEAKTFLEKLPKGLDTYVNQWMEHEDGTSGVDLSGGQKQRLALARNFYRDSPIIILDEPTSAIDALAESRIFKRLFAKKNKTIITVSHRLTTVQKADVIYVLKDGTIVEHGTHKELAAKKGEYYKLFESQM